MKAICFVTILALTAAGPLLAQEEAREKPQPQPTEQSKDQIKVTDDELKLRVSEVNKASKFIGMTVRNTQDEKLGKVSDLAIDHDSGKIAYAVLSAGGFLGVKDKLIAVPLQALTLEKGAEYL